MTAEQGIRALSQERNRELLIDAMVEAIGGLFFCLLAFGLTYLITWLFVAVRDWPMIIPPIVTGLVILGSFVCAWCCVRPLAHLPRKKAPEDMISMIAVATSEVLWFHPRRRPVGLSRLLLGGPTNITSALGTLLHRLPSGPDVLRNAAAALRHAEKGIPIAAVEDPRAVLLLLRLSLVRSVARVDPANDTVELTDKGRDVLEGGVLSGH